jgi:hypothetical protein
MRDNSRPITGKRHVMKRTIKDYQQLIHSDISDRTESKDSAETTQSRNHNQSRAKKGGNRSPNQHSKSNSPPDLNSAVIENRFKINATTFFKTYFCMKK